MGIPLPSRPVAMALSTAVAITAGIGV